MEHAEANGKTVDDALRAALGKLGAAIEEVDLIVLDEGRRGGLFGRGARDAVVRVERRAGGPREPAPEPPPDTSIPRARGTAAGPARGGRSRRGGRARGPGAGRSGERPQRSGRTGERAPELREEDFFGGEAPKPPARAPAPRRGPSQPSRPRREPPRDREREPARERDRDRDRPRRRRDEEPVDPDIHAEQVELAAEVTDAILGILDIDAGIDIREPETAGDGLGSALAVIDISGDDLGMLIGRRGESLMAFQYVVNLVVTRRHPGRGAVTLDVEGYRRRREEQLVALAERMAGLVREHGDPITLEPMPPAERRLVHLALADDPDVETASAGEGDSRKVVISPRER